MRKATIILIVYLLITTIFSGCGSLKSEESREQTGQTASSMSNSDISRQGSVTQDVPVKLEFFNMKREVVDILDAAIKQFEKENPGYVIEQNIMPDPFQALQTRMSSGDTPEIFTSWPTSTWKAQVKEGFILDLTGDACLKNIQDSVLNAYKIDGKDYIAPISYNTMGIFYNKKIFRELGLAIPKTYSELIDICRKIKAAGKVPFIFQAKDPYALIQDSMTLMVSMSDYDRFITDTMAGDLKLDDKTRNENLRRLGEKYLELYSYAQTDALYTGYDQGVIDFANGKAAMMIMGSWVIGPIKKANPDMDFEMFPMPAETEDRLTAVAYPGDFAICISSKAVHPAESKRFIEVLCRPEFAKIYAEKDGSFSCIKGVDVIVPQLTKQFEMLKSGRYKTNPDALWLESVRVNLGQALEKLLIGRDIDQWMRDWEKAFKETPATGEKDFNLSLR